jgi:VanZ like family
MSATPEPLPAGVRLLRLAGRALLALGPATRWIPAAAWMALVFVLSMQSFGRGGVSGWFWGIASNGYHCFEYGVLALCFALYAPREQGWPRIDRRATIAIVVAAGLYGLSDELHQLFVPSRSSSALDLLSDVTGAWLATRAVARAGGVGYDARALLRIVLLGIPLCIGCAALANWGGAWLPWLVWS